MLFPAAQLYKNILTQIDGGSPNLFRWVGVGYIRPLCFSSAYDFEFSSSKFYQSRDKSISVINDSFLLCIFVKTNKLDMSEDYKYEVYVDYMEVPVLKERYNLIFAKGPYEALYETELISDFADSFFDGDLEEAEDDLKGSNAMCIHFTKKKNMMILIIPYTVKVGVVSHECFHLTKMILEKKGIYLSNGTEEIYAHLLDYLVEEVSRMLKKVKITRRKNSKKKK